MKKLIKNVLVCGAACIAVSCAQNQNVTVETGKYTPDWENLKQWECPEWFKDAKFGLWAHWGPQNQAEAGDWYARHLYYEDHWQGQHHRRTYGSPESYGLKDLINDWKAEEWDPDSLIRLYKSVGAKYFMSMGNHHDNFDNWNSPYQEWNSVNVGPKKDIIKGWAEACEKYGLPFGVSMHASHAWSWLEISQKYDGNLTKEDGKGTWWEGLDPQELYAQNHPHSENWENSGAIHGQWNWGNGVVVPSEEYKMKFQNRVLECVNTFKPDMLYFDDTVMPFYGCDDQVGLNILSHFYNSSAKWNDGDQSVVVMGKILEPVHKEAMLWDVERGAPDRAQEKYWQTCTCIGGWHYNRNDYNSGNYKSSQQVISMLIDIVSKNGNLLLSVPMRASGSIDEKVMAVLEGIKEWMDVNGQSIYGTRTWKTFGEGPQAEASNPINAQGFNESNNYSAADIRFVQRNDTVFATTLRYPEGKTLTIKAFGLASPYYSGKVKKITLIGYGPVNFTENVEGVVIEMPETKVNKLAAAFAVEFDKDATGGNVADLVSYYAGKLEALRPLAGNATGKYDAAKLDAFEQMLNDNAATVSALNAAYAELKNSGLEKVVVDPAADGAEDVTAKYLVEAENFSRKDGGDKRFGTPANWTVENFSIPNGDAGVKNGLDKHTGRESLMLGVWNDRRASQKGDLSNARIYRTVRLEPGKYFFGAAYNTVYSFTGNAYMFASNGVLNTSDIAAKSIACSLLSDASADGKFYGISFTLDKAQTVTLGFQADLSVGSRTQEFRAEKVKLLQYK